MAEPPRSRPDTNLGDGARDLGRAAIEVTSIVVLDVVIEIVLTLIVEVVGGILAAIFS